MLNINNNSSGHVVNKNKYIIYRELKNRIKRGAIYNDTQLDIENFLFHSDIGNLNKKFSNLYEFLGCVNMDFKKIFFNVEIIY